MSKNVFTFDINMQFKELSKNKAADFGSLSRKKIRDSKSLFIIEGEKCVADSLNCFDLVNLVCTKEWLEANPTRLDKISDRVLVAKEPGLMKKISSLSSVPDVIGIFSKPRQPLDIPILDKDSLYLLLDEIQDPGNLGTIIRTCNWFGVKNVFASKGTVDIYNQKTVQSAMGSIGKVNVVYCDLGELITKNRELPVFGTLLEGENYTNLKSGTTGFLIMGNEGNGISPHLKSMVTKAITIPPANDLDHPDSLNVAIATAIILSRIC
ncbi:MAG: RNA methyltransferase [Muribaculaceae bacterium]|nr:RNA methyltransferase [Muribaculaceae bacterium]